MRELLEFARSLDDTRMYAEASNPHYGEAGGERESDFYTAQKFHEYPLRATFANMEGYLNHSYPNARTDYSASMAEVRKFYGGPVFSFEVGQYEVLPDFGELEKFHGVCLPENLRLICRGGWKRAVFCRIGIGMWKPPVNCRGSVTGRKWRQFSGRSRCPGFLCSVCRIFPDKERPLWG